MANDQIVGKYGEDIASKQLTSNGYSIIKRNFRSRFGEIDIVAKKNNTLSFVEVKTRIGIKKGMPYEAITSWKQRHMQKSAEFYVLQNPSTCKLRLDVISIVLNEDKSVKELRHFENITA